MPLTARSADRRRMDPGQLPSVPRRRALGALVLGLVALVTTLGYLKPDPFAQHRTVQAVFREAAGTSLVGGEVRMAGTPVGEVTDRRRIGDDALLTLELDDDVGPISADATAQLRPRTAFEGPAFVELQPGTPGGPPLRGAIPLAQTRNFVALDEALRFARPSARQALRDNLRSARAALRGPGTTGLSRALRAAPRLTERLAIGARAARGEHGGDLRRAVTRLADTAEAVAAQRHDLVPLLRGAQRSFAAVNADAGVPLDRALATLAARMQELDSGSRALDSLVGRLDTVGSALRPALRATPAALRDTGGLLHEATPVLRQTPPLLAALRGALAAGARSAPAAGRLLVALSPSVKLLDASLLPALGRRSSLGIPVYQQFLALFQGGAGASRPFQTEAQSQPPSMGPGHYMRFGARFFTGMGYPLPPCSAVDAHSEDLATALGRAGMCNP